MLSESEQEIVFVIYLFVCNSKVNILKLHID